MKSITEITVEHMCGTKLDNALRDAIQLAAIVKKDVKVRFNGSEIMVDSISCVSRKCQEFWDEWDKKAITGGS